MSLLDHLFKVQSQSALKTGHRSRSAVRCKVFISANTKLTFTMCGFAIVIIQSVPFLDATMCEQFPFRANSCEIFLCTEVFSRKCLSPSIFYAFHSEAFVRYRKTVFSLNSCAPSTPTNILQPQETKEKKRHYFSLGEKWKNSMNVKLMVFR